MNEYTLQTSTSVRQTMEDAVQTLRVLTRRVALRAAVTRDTTEMDLTAQVRRYSLSVSV